MLNLFFLLLCSITEAVLRIHNTMSSTSYRWMSPSRRHDYLSKWRLTKRGFLLPPAFIAFILLFHLTLYQKFIPSYQIPTSTDSTILPTLPPGDRKFVIILPADGSSPDLCKVIASGVALGYPAPVIVNWKEDFQTEEQGIGPSQLGKITGTLSYLDWATRDDIPKDEKLNDDDIVLMMDAHDVWFQLPPSVLLQRYFESNQRANKRLADENDFFDAELMQQSIVVSAQKGCIAPRDTVSDLYCGKVPESTLPSDIYGFWTDYTFGRWKFMRPRYMNSGNFMGPVGDMRKYFRRVKEKMDQHLINLTPDQELGGDQGIFAQVFGEQEAWRNDLRKQHRAGDAAGREMSVLLRDEFEYHVGLDYMQDLFYPTCYSEIDGFFVALDDNDAVQDESSRLGVSPPRVHGTPTDIDEAESPLSSISTQFHWGEIPLYADFWTTAVPVVLHHNAWRNGLKNRRVTWWDKMWFFPYLRALLEAQIKTTAPLATLRAGHDSLRIWPYGTERQDKRPMLFGKSRTGNQWVLRTAEWGAVCRDKNDTIEAASPWYDEVFRDGRGNL